MKTLIIAAGNGSRLNQYTKDIPKTLISLGDKSIIETILDNCKKSGLNDFVIVTGYLEEKLKNFINKLGVNVEFISNKEFYKENGVSVYCAKNALINEDKFLLIMADHVFDANLLKNVIDYKLTEGCVLAIDRNLSNMFDLQEATKVNDENGKVLDIGKNIKEYNAVDTGFFLCTQDIFESLEKSIQKGSDNLSDAMKLLAEKRKLSTIDISGNFWLDIDIDKDLEFARKHFSPIIV